MDALIGYTGFVGSNLARQHRFDAAYNSKNIEEIGGRSFDTLVFSGAQAKKWWANANPDADWDGIARALRALDSVRADRVMLISTVDVVPALTGSDEGFDCRSVANHAYGVNRLRLEEELRARFPATTIVRLPGLFGRGLQKNVIFDLLNRNLLEKINPLSRFQYYDLDRLWDDLAVVRNAGIDLMHLVTEPVATAEILRRFFPDVPVGLPDERTAVSYDIRTRHDALFSGAAGYIFPAEEVLARLEAFIASTRQ